MDRRLSFLAPLCFDLVSLSSGPRAALLSPTCSRSGASVDSSSVLSSVSLLQSALALFFLASLRLHSIHLASVILCAYLLSSRLPSISTVASLSPHVSVSPLLLSSSARISVFPAPPSLSPAAVSPEVASPWTPRVLPPTPRLLEAPFAPRVRRSRDAINNGSVSLHAALCTLGDVLP